ncbi:MAG: recombinase family protein [Clostridia bacterium]|nr:recombinase family protein [Clostridia bacterium]
MPKKEKDPIIAAAYYRFSSHKQNEQSIEGQRRDCERYAEQNGIKIVKEYVDRALTAKSDARPAFQQVIKDSSKGIFNTVIVWKLDRFARNRYDSAHYKAKLRKNGVKLISAMEPIPDTPEGILMESLLEGMAEYYSADLAQKMRRGMRESARKLKMLGGTPPLGYKRDAEGKYMIDEENAEIVKLIFEMYINGSTNTEIVKYLNKHGYRNAVNKEFTNNSIYSILGNVRYTGTYKYDDIVIPDAIPVIISKETFEKAQKTKNKNRTTLRRHYSERAYPLATKLFCSCCNSMMIGVSGTGNGGRYYYYRCQNHKKKLCPVKNVRAEPLEELVVKALSKMILDDDKVREIALKLYEANEAERDRSMIQSLEKQLEDCEAGIDNITKAIESGVLSKSLTNRLSELEDQQIDLRYSLEQEKAKAPDITIEQLEFMLCKLREDINNTEHNEKLIQTFVHRVYYNADEIIIWLNITKPTPGNDDNKELEKLVYEGLSNHLQSSPRKKSTFCRNAGCRFFIYTTLSYHGHRQLLKPSASGYHSVRVIVLQNMSVKADTHPHPASFNGIDKRVIFKKVLYILMLPVMML